MRRQQEFISRGYPYGTDILYVYCDKCGSFSIQTYLSGRKWLLIITFIGLMIIGSSAAFSSNRLNLGGFFFLVICILGLKFLWGDTDYRCRKCGNRQIIVNNPKDLASEIPKFNTRNLPADMSVIDVPDELTQKRYQGYWDDDYQ